MKTKAIIFDIDGTVIDSPVQKLASGRLKDAFKKIESEYYLSAATGRVWSFAKPVIEDLELEDPCIIAGGTQIYNPKTGEILWQLNIEKPDAEAAINILRDYPEYKLLFNDYIEEDYLHGGLTVDDIDLSASAYFIEATFVPEDAANEMIARLSNIEGLAVTLVVSQKPGLKDIHVTNKAATKEHAVAEVLKMLDVDKAKTTGIGDGHNDTHLFNSVGLKVAMGNGVSELKEAADVVIGDVSDDGLAEYIESLSY